MPSASVRFDGQMAGVVFAALLPSHQGSDECTALARVAPLGQAEAVVQLVLPDGPAVLGGPFSARIEGAPPGSEAFLALGLSTQPLFDPALGFTIYPAAPLAVLAGPVDALGRSAPMLATGGIGAQLCGLEFTLQGAATASPGSTQLLPSQALEVRVGVPADGLLPGWILPTSLPFRESAVGDFDGDGRLELATATGRSEPGPDDPGRGLAVFAFEAGSVPEERFTVTEEREVFALRVADLEPDGRLDLAYLLKPAAPLETTLLRTRAGIGDGTFGAPVDLDLEARASDALLADVTGDGREDLVYVTEESPTVFVRPGGPGGFGPPQFDPLGSPSAVRELHAADFDADGDLDLVLHLVTGQGASRLRTSRNDGIGGFSNAGSADIEIGHVVQLAVGDLDEDAATELIALTDLQPTLRTFDVDDQLAVHPAREFSLPATSGKGALHLADLDLDGRLDLIASDGYANVYLMQGGSDGNLTPRGKLDVRFGCLGLATLDASNDGWPDVVSGSGAAEFVLHYGSGELDFDQPRTTPATGQPYDLRIGDVDGDGRPDLVTAGDPKDLDSFPYVDVALSRGDGSFEPAELRRFSTLPVDVRLRDLDGDGALDLALVRDDPLGVQALGRLELFRGGDALLEAAPAVFPTLAFPDRLRFGDLDGDGSLDLAVTSRVPSVEGGLAWQRGLPDGSFGPFAPLEAELRVSELESLDADLDGDLDLVLVRDETAELWRNDGAAAFTVEALHPSLSIAGPLALADLDGDPSTDLIVRNREPGSPNAFELVTLRGTPAGAFEPIDRLALHDRIPRRLATADLDGDGDLDLLAASRPLLGSAGLLVEWIENTGGGALGPRCAAVVPNVSKFAYDLGATDLDGNGTADLALARYASGAVTLYLNRLGQVP